MVKCESDYQEFKTNSEQNTCARQFENNWTKTHVFCLFQYNGKMLVGWHQWSKSSKRPIFRYTCWIFLFGYKAKQTFHKNRLLQAVWEGFCYKLRAMRIGNVTLKFKDRTIKSPVKIRYSVFLCVELFC